jgi:hypothetical protein
LIPVRFAETSWLRSKRNRHGSGFGEVEFEREHHGLGGRGL